MKILICGDSFMADWTVKYPDQQGWCNHLAREHQVVNLAQAGASEYKIWKQLDSADLRKFDALLISHTSPNRLHCKEHPVHQNCPLHGNADLIYADVSPHTDNEHAVLAVNYYRRYFDFDQAQDVAFAFCEKILDKLKHWPTLPVFHLQVYREERFWRRLLGGASYHGHRYPMIGDHFNLYPILRDHRGLMCHLSDQGNELLLTEVQQWLDRCL